MSFPASGAHVCGDSAIIFDIYYALIWHQVSMGHGVASPASNATTTPPSTECEKCEGFLSVRSV